MTTPDPAGIPPRRPAVNRAERRAARSVAKLPYVANATATAADDITAAAAQVDSLVSDVVDEVRGKLAEGWDREVVLAWLSAELAKLGPDATATLAAGAIVRLTHRRPR